MSELAVKSLDMPWHHKAWARITAHLSVNRMPHALLVRGPTGVGKQVFATRMVASLLCLTRDGNAEACEHCHGCRLRAGDAHPDLMQVFVEKGRSRIRVDQTRALQEFIHLSSQYGHYRVAVVVEADAMNAQAANALLKTLEEPPANAVLILVSTRPARLPATIRSRCYTVSLQPPEQRVAINWLEKRAPEAVPLLGLAGDAPLRAMALANDDGEARYFKLLEQLMALRTGAISPVTAAMQWHDHGRVSFTELLQIALCELQRYRVAGEYATRGPRSDVLPRLASTVDWNQLQTLYEGVTQRRAEAEQPLQAQLMIEALLTEWVATCKQAWG